MIAITGSTGQLGQLAIHHLLKTTDPSSIVALARSPEKANHLKEKGVTVREADYEKPATLQAALKDVKKVLFISGSEIGKRAAQHQAVVDAAKQAQVELLVYTSVLKASDSPLSLAEEHRVTEAAIKAAKLPAVILRNGWYTENYTQSVGSILQAGVMAGAAKEGKFHAAPRKDYAEATANVLLAPGDFIGKEIDLCGDQGFTLQEFASTLSELSGKSIPYQNMAGDDYKKLLMQVGLPEPFAALFADSELAAAEGWLASKERHLSQLLKRPTTPLKESMQEALNQ
ncbi:MAG: SDR family oxidoreductase [Cellvibrionaceae bacterium]|nr:SDR family oxidoreductase [Cellvibrionaceae bacterium]